MNANPKMIITTPNTAATVENAGEMSFEITPVYAIITPKMNTLAPIRIEIRLALNIGNMINIKPIMIAMIDKSLSDSIFSPHLVELFYILLLNVYKNYYFLAISYDFLNLIKIFWIFSSSPNPLKFFQLII